jgi:protein SCO1/2
MKPLPAALRRALLVCMVGGVAALSFHLSAPPEAKPQRGAAPRQSDKLSNIVLQTQHGKPVRFYDDLVRGRTVLINLMYSGCGDVCPANSAALATLHDLLGGRVGRDIAILSISIDPAGDTPERLKRYWAAFGAKPGWLFLTGKPGEVDRLRRELGLYDPDPVVDADITQHAGTLTVGNDRADTWRAFPVLMDAKQLALAVLRVAGEEPAERGRVDYLTYCASCHGAKGDGDGPLAAMLEPKPAHHTDAARMSALSDEYLFRLLKEGGPALGRSPLMNAWGRNLSDAQIHDLIAYLRVLSAEPGAR